MGINDRIRQSRVALGLTQAGFGEKIGLKQNTVGQIETGKRGITERTIILISECYNVNENWLRTGEGDMFVPVDNFEMQAKYVQELLFNKESSFYNLINSILTAYSQLNQTEMEVADKIIDKVLDNYKNS